MTGLALCCQWVQWICLAFMRLPAMSVDLPSVSVDSCPVLNSSRGFSFTVCISMACTTTMCPRIGCRGLGSRSHQVEQTHTSPFLQQASFPVGDPNCEHIASITGNWMPRGIGAQIVRTGAQTCAMVSGVVQLYPPRPTPDTRWKSLKGRSPPNRPDIYWKVWAWWKFWGLRPPHPPRSGVGTELKACRIPWQGKPLDPTGMNSSTLPTQLP